MIHPDILTALKRIARALEQIADNTKKEKEQDGKESVWKNTKT